MSNMAPDPDQILQEGAQQFEQPAQAEPEQASEYKPPTEQEMQEVAQAYFALQQQLANVTTAYQNMVNQGQQEEDDPNVIASDDDEDSLDPEAIRQIIREEAVAAQDQALAQNPMIQAIAEQRGSQIAEQAFDAWKPELGEINRDLALNLANAYGAQNPQLHPLQALRMGAEAAKQQTEAIRKQVAEEYATNMKNRMEAPRQVPQGSEAAVEGRPKSTNYDEVTRDFLARRNLQVSAN